MCDQTNGEASRNRWSENVTLIPLQRGSEMGDGYNASQISFGNRQFYLPVLPSLPFSCGLGEAAFFRSIHLPQSRKSQAILRSTICTVSSRLFALRQNFNPKVPESRDGPVGHPSLSNLKRYWKRSLCDTLSCGHVKGSRSRPTGLEVTPLAV